ncbi:MAG: restriction endonuclease subunit S [Deltaproteobacteria bacterium]|jgi:type I restriction enzyme S subunit|nr:restriction endonuclease subunit S [Deltaproteobacteria bacterium]
MKDGLQENKLGDICTFINGMAFKPTDWVLNQKDTLPIIRIQNLNNNNSLFNYYNKTVDNKYIVNHGDLLFSWSGSKGSSFGAHIWYGDKAILNQHIFKVIFDPKKYLKKYLFHKLNSIIPEVEDNLNGAVGLVHITKTKLTQILILTHSLNEQYRIVSILDTAFEALSQAKIETENNLARANELFQSELTRIFREKGEGWEEKKLGEIAIIGSGNPAPQDKKYFENGTIPFFRTSDIGAIKVGIIKESKDYINTKITNKYKLFPAGTIVLPKSGASTFLNHRVIIGVDGFVSSHLATIISKENVIINKFLFYMLCLVKAQSLLQDIAYPSLNISVIENINVWLPNLQEQSKIIDYLDNLTQLKNNITNEYSTKIIMADEFKQSLLHHAFNGEL